MSTNPGSTVGMGGSYNENSDPQLAIINLMTPYIHLGIDELDVSSSHLIIADFEDKSYQGVANGVSFYEQCLPVNSLSLGFTASSMHWLSKIPFNIKNHCFHTYAEEHERQAYTYQAKLDFSAFIEHRSRELVSGGILVLSIPSFDDEGLKSITNYFDVLYMCAETFFNKQELLHFTVPIYLRSLSECVDYELFDRCSLQLIKAELSHLNVPTLEQYHNGQLTFDQLAKIFTKVFQSTMEPLVNKVLEMSGRSKEEIDELSRDFWMIYEVKLKETRDLVVNGNQYVCACLVLKKI